MATVWTAAQLQRYTLQGEQLFHQDCQCIIDRVALDIVSGTANYTLPDSCVDIRRITYRGTRLSPISHRSMRRYFDGLNPTGKPYNYIFDNLGQMVIKLFPTPSETIVGSTSDLFSPATILANCIVEYYAAPDGVQYTLPVFMRRRLLKAYVLKQAYAGEGKGQNIKASKYWAAKWEYMKDAYTDKVFDIITAPRKLLASNLDYDLAKKLTVPRPVLPLNMLGVGVDPDDDY